MRHTYFFRSLLSMIARFFLGIVISLGSILSPVLAGDPPDTGDNLMSTGFIFKASEFLGGVSSNKITTKAGKDSNTTEKNLKSFGGSIAKTILNILVIATIIMTVISGILMVTSYGNTEKAEKAKSILTTCASALVLALFANAMIRVVLLLLASN